ncbi:MAG: hypothetical protein Q4A23_02735 [bacterium]|nr:hypothetical protein [bacterium]
MNSEILKTKIRRVKYKVSKDWFTIDNLIMICALIIAMAWIWGSISAMERNYKLQLQLEIKNREKIISEIRYKTLKYENQYLKSDEYQELAARENLGLVNPGEHVLILSKYPENKEKRLVDQKKDSNFVQWMNFIFGGSAKKV